MPNRETIQIPGLEEVSRHGHLCVLCEGEEEIVASVIPFIQKGIALGEAAVYLNAAEDALERILRNAVLGEHHDTGALKVLPPAECWLKDGRFDSARVLELLRTLSTAAADDGFRSVRVIADLRWALQEPDLISRLPELERGLNTFTQEADATVLCLYERSAFPADRLLELARSHPQVVIAGKVCGNPLYLAPDSDRHVGRARRELDLFLSMLESATGTALEREQLHRELEQAYAALARKIYENWQEEDALRANEKELHEKDTALLEHRRRLQTILQHLPAIMMAFDRGHSLVSCNHEFERLTGYRAEEAMGKQLLELLEVSGEGRAEVVAAHPDEGGDYRGREWELRCKDGSLKRASWSNFSRYVQIPGWANWIMGLDISPRVQAEQGLRSLADELDARATELEALGFAISHDLSGQLAKISSHCSTMRELYAVALSPQCRELLTSIHESTLEMAGRINALQRFTSLAADELQPEEVDLSAMASEIAAKLKADGLRPVTFRIEDGLTATGDAKLLRLAMEQLLENAWHYTLGVDAPLIQFGTAEVAGERSFYVSDNGRRQGAASVARQGRGAKSEHLCCGIGLATVQRIITLHRGRIWATEQPEGGGTLHFMV